MSLIIRLEELLGKVKLDSACIVLPLRTGSIITGCLSLVVGVCGIGWDATYITHGGIQSVQSGLGLALGILFVMATVLLLYGIFKREPVFMLPYIITEIIQITLGGILAVILNLVTLSLLSLGIALLLIALHIYFFLILSSYYLELRQGA